MGHAWCWIEGERLRISDLKVDGRAFIPYPFAHNLLMALCVPPRSRNFRRRGIGDLIMQEVFSEARKAGIRELWGSVMQADIERAPWLLDWYGRLGFAVMEPDAECIPGAARKILMRIEGNGRPDRHGEGGTDARPIACPRRPDRARHARPPSARPREAAILATMAGTLGRSAVLRRSC